MEEEKLQDGIELFSKCFELIRASDNDGVKYATDQIDSLVTNPFSIEVLINFFRSQNDPIMRQFGLISLKSSIKNCWLEIPLEARVDLFRDLLDLLIHETIWVNRFSLIICIKESMTSEFDEILLSFIKQAFETNEDEFLEVALLLAQLIPSDEEKLEEYSSLIPFFTNMFIKGLESDQPEVKLAGFYFLCYSKLFEEAHFFEQSPEHWENIVGLFDFLVSDKQQFNRLIEYFNYCFQQGIFTGDPSSLIFKIMSFFNDETPLDENELLNLLTIIQSLSRIYAEDLSTSDLIGPLIELHIAMSFQLYNPDDSLPLSNAQFFEETFQCLCINQESIDILWSSCLNYIESNEGLFVFLRAVASTFDNAPEYYIMHIDDITDFLRDSILSDSELLRDAAARTADELIKYYVFESDELSITLTPIVVKACQENVSEYLLQVCSRLLDTTKKTEEYFDDTFPFMVDLVQSSPFPGIQDAALQCLGSLAQWSTTKIDRNLDDILPLLIDLLRSSADHQQYLKPPVVDFIGKLAEAVGSPLDEFLRAVIPFFVENMESEDAALSFSCIETIRLVVQYHKDTIAEFIGDIVPKLMEQASSDNSEEMMEALNNPTPESDPMAQTVFKIPGLALRVLGVIYKNISNEEDDKLWDFVYECLNELKMSYHPYIKSSVAVTISSLMNGFFIRVSPKEIQDEEEEIKKVVEKYIIIIIGLLSTSQDMEVSIDIYMTLKDMVNYFCYLIFDPDVLENILDVTCEFLKPEIALKYRPNERSRDLYEEILDFLKMFIISASSKAPELLANDDDDRNVTKQYYELLHIENLRFRSFAIRYFGYLITYYENLSKDLQQDIIKIAIQMAKDDNEYGAFVAIQQIAYYIPDLMIDYQEEVIEILMEKLSMPFIAKEKMLLMRDNCVIALAFFSQSTYQGYFPIDFEKCAPIALRALPIAVDHQDPRKMKYVSQFFLKMYENCKELFPDLFLRVLVVTFANPRAVLDEMKFDKIELLEVLLELMEELPNAEDLCAEILKDDPSKIEFLEDILTNGY